MEVCMLNMKCAWLTYFRNVSVSKNPHFMDTNELEESFLDVDDVDYASGQYDVPDLYGTHERGVQYSHPSQLVVPSQCNAGISVNASRPIAVNSTYSNPVAVDLSLASSYLPGIYAMLKVLVFLSALNIMQKLGMHMDQALIVCAACLYIDRCTSICYIMDTSSCALCVLVSVCVNASRIGIDGEPGIVNMSISFCWFIVSILILCDVHRSLMRRNSQMSGIVNFITSSFCAIHGFLCLDVEVDLIAYMRAVVFTTLTVLWIYTVKLRQRHDMYDSFSNCVDRFAVVLVADVYVGGAYAILACLVIAWRYQKSNTHTHVPLAEVACEPAAVVWPVERRDIVSTTWTAERRGISNNTPTPPDTDPVEMDVHVAFRLAQANARKGVHAR